MYRVSVEPRGGWSGEAEKKCYMPSMSEWKRMEKLGDGEVVTVLETEGEQ